MRNVTAFTFAAAFMLAVIGTVQAKDAYPDLRGTWVGKGSAIVVGAPTHHEKGEPENPRLSEQTFTFKFTEQKGDRFWGTFESAKGKEYIIGIIAPDKKRVLVAIEAGTADGRMLDANTFEWCYDQHTKEATMLSCNTVRRQKK